MSGDAVIDPMASARIHAAWIAPTPDAVRRLHDELMVPGNLALRTRFETVADLASSRLPASAFDVPWELWSRQVVLLADGDAGLHTNDLEAARAAFTALRESHVDEHHPLPLIDAEIGLGEVARQADDLHTATQHLAAAIRLAGRHYCRFAEVRARIALGYVQLNAVGAAAAESTFGAAVDVARSRGWRLDLANALLGRGECRQRLTQQLPVMRDHLEALTHFERVRSVEGVANATLHLGEVTRRLRWTDEAHGWYSQAAAAASQRGDTIGIANALDGLAEIEIQQGRLTQARRHLGQSARAALGGYPRGFAHALNGLGRCALHGGDPATALGFFHRARQMYLELGLATSAATSCHAIAACADRLDEPTLAMAARLHAVELIEGSRAGQITHRDQAEYVDRFGGHYTDALRTAIVVGDLSAYIAVFEAMAGRRLAALLDHESGSEQAALLAQLAQMNAEARLRNEPVESDSASRLARLLGRAALSTTLPAMARQAFDDVMAEGYRPFDIQTAPQLWERAVLDRAAVVLMADANDCREILWLAHVDGAPAPHGGSHVVSDECARMLRGLASGLSLDATLADLAPLADLMPPELVALLPPGRPTTLVPVGRLWNVPWPAIAAPTSQKPDRLLAEATPLVLCPSLAFAAQIRPEPPEGRTLGSVAWWRSEQVLHHDLIAFSGRDSEATPAVRPLRSAADARIALLDADADLVVLVGHGRPLAEMVHYIDLDDALGVTPADLLTATPPREIALITCWGASTPGGLAGDRVSVVSLALARGAHSIVASTSELRDDAPASTFVNMVVHNALSSPLPLALHDAQRALLARPDLRVGYVSRWAPLIAFGG